MMNPKLSNDVFVAPDVAPMVPTDDELAKLARSLRQLEPLAKGDRPLGPAVPPVDTSFRAAAVGDLRQSFRRRTIGSRIARAVKTVVLIAAATGAAVIALQSYGGAAEQTIAKAPQRILASLLPLVSAIIAGPSSRSADPATTADSTPPKPDYPGLSTAPDSVELPASGPSNESAQSSASTTSDIASMRQEIEQLRGTIEELKAGQQQMSRDVAKVSEAKASEQNLRPTISLHPGQVRKPAPQRQQTAAYPTLLQRTPPPQQPVAPYVPRQVEALPRTTPAPAVDPELALVPRPPLPVR
jgi:hypothetical protein